MRILELSLAEVLALIVPIAAHADGPGSNPGSAGVGPAPGILGWDGGGSADAALWITA
jgi:hypothetical protein